MPLGLLIALMLGISSEGIQAYAMTNQSITAESGYWYYVKISDNLNYRICNKRCFILVSLC